MGERRGKGKVIHDLQSAMCIEVGSGSGVEGYVCVYVCVCVWGYGGYLVFTIWYLQSSDIYVS